MHRNCRLETFSKKRTKLIIHDFLQKAKELQPGGNPPGCNSFIKSVQKCCFQNMIVTTEVIFSLCPFQSNRFGAGAAILESGCDL